MHSSGHLLGAARGLPTRPYAGRVTPPHGNSGASTVWPPGAIRARRVINMINLATPLGLAVARFGGARIVRGPHGLLLARDYRAKIPAPSAPAVTIGDVVLLRLDDDRLARRPRLLDHEARHAMQYARWLGPFGFLPAYLLSSAWSWWRTGDFALGNAFERRAGLADGGYLREPDGPPGRDRVLALLAVRRRRRS